MQSEEMESDQRGCSSIGQRQCLSTVTREKVDYAFTDIGGFSLHINLLYPLTLSITIMCIVRFRAIVFGFRISLKEKC